MSRIDTLRLQFERLRSNRVFEWMVITIILISALVVGAKTYEETSRYTQLLLWLDGAITLFFLTEIIVRILAEKNLRTFFSKGWNIFDFLIVTASLIPINESDMVLVARLLRVFRVLRLVSLIPELRVLMAALLKSIPRMGYVALLMFIIFYIYGAIGSFLFERVDSFLWGNITTAMLTLFRVATFEDWTDVMYATMEVHPWSWVYFLSFIFLTAFIFLNMMIGIVLDVMQRESAEVAAAEQHARGQLTDAEQIRAQLDRIEQRLDDRENRDRK